MATKTVGVQPPGENPVEGVLKFLNSLERVDMRYKPGLPRVVEDMDVWGGDVKDQLAGGMNFRLSTIGPEKKGLGNIIMTWELPPRVRKYCGIEGIDWVSVELGMKGDKKYRHSGLGDWPSKPGERISMIEDFFTEALGIVIPKFTSAKLGLEQDLAFQSAKTRLAQANRRNPPPGSGEVPGLK